MMKHNLIKNTVKTSALLTVVVVVSGCLGPTYGTGKTQTELLMEDVGGMLSLAPKGKKEKIAYTPRPDVVKTAPGGALPAPQQAIETTSAEWPESPEQKRQRILNDIEQGQRPANFVTNKTEAASLGASEGPGRGTTAGYRTYLTDPPTEYREPAQTAQYGELGESEAKKARAAKQAQGKKGGWRSWLPGG